LVIAIISDSVLAIEPHLTKIEEVVDEQGANHSIELAVQRLRQALDELREEAEED
jgi:competence protein ComGC